MHVLTSLPNCFGASDAPKTGVSAGILTRSSTCVCVGGGG